MLTSLSLGSHAVGGAMHSSRSSTPPRLLLSLCCRRTGRPAAAISSASVWRSHASLPPSALRWSSRPLHSYPCPRPRPLPSLRPWQPLSHGSHPRASPPSAPVPPPRRLASTAASAEPRRASNPAPGSDSGGSSGGSDSAGGREEGASSASTAAGGGSGGGDGGADTRSGAGAGAAGGRPEGDSGDGPTGPPERFSWYVVVGGLTVSAVLLLSGWALYSSNYVSDYISQSLLSELARQGPSSLVDLNGPGDKWQLIHVSGTLRQRCAQTEYLSRLMEGLDPEEHIVEIQRMCLVILSELAHDSSTFKLVCQQPGLSSALLKSALLGSKDVSQMSFVLLKQLSASEEQRDEMIKAKALQSACRAVKSDKPEVAGSASELLGALVHHVDEAQIKALTADERRYVFNALANLGNMFSENGLSQSAVDCFRLCLHLEPNHAMVQTALGMEQLKLGLNEQAIATLRKAVRQDPNNGEAVFHLYKTLFQHQQLAGQLSPEQLRAAVQQLRGAVAALQTAQFGNGALQSSVHPILSPAYHLLVKAMERAGQLTDAVAAAEEWTLYCPTEAVAHFTYGRLLLAASRPSEAEAPLSRAQRLDSSKAQTAYQLALVAYKQGRVQQADERVKQAYSIAQQHDPALHRLLTAADSPPSLSAAVAVTSSALPPASEAVLCQLDLLRAKLCIAQQRHSEAVSALQRYLAYRPNDAAALRLYALCLQAAGRQAEAYHTFARMMQAVAALPAEGPNNGASDAPQASPLLAIAVSSPARLPRGGAVGASQDRSQSVAAVLARHRALTGVLDSIAAACKQSSSVDQQPADVKDAFELMCNQQRQLQTMIDVGSKKNRK